jgi:hypothetical protein
LSQISDTIGLIKKYEKYKTVRIWPIITYGSSTGRAPIHVSKEAIIINLQNKNLLTGYILDALKLKMLVSGTIIKIKIDKTKATTPPSLLGIDRRIA